jgi:hypothetical protein
MGTFSALGMDESRAVWEGCIGSIKEPSPRAAKIKFCTAYRDRKGKQQVAKENAINYREDFRYGNT